MGSCPAQKMPGWLVGRWSKGSCLSVRTFLSGSIAARRWHQETACLACETLDRDLIERENFPMGTAGRRISHQGMPVLVRESRGLQVSRERISVWLVKCHRGAKRSRGKFSVWLAKCHRGAKRSRGKFSVWLAKCHRGAKWSLDKFDCLSVERGFTSDLWVS